MEGGATPPPANPNQNTDGNDHQDDQNNDNDDNNAPAGPSNVLPNQPAPQPPPAHPTGPPIPAPDWPQPVPCQPPPQIIHQQMVNWSNFKPEFAGKPEEDAEVHLLYTNDLMWTHNFEENVKVQRFC